MYLKSEKNVKTKYKLAAQSTFLKVLFKQFRKKTFKILSNAFVR